MSQVAHSELMAFTADHVCHLTGLTKRQLGYWDKTGFFSPALADDDLGRRPFGRVYSFRDLVGLRTIAILRERVALQELRRVGEWLEKHSDTPWSSLRLGLSGKRVTFTDPATGVDREARTGEQGVFSVALQRVATQMGRAADRLRNRKRDQVGKVERHRYVAHNKAVIAGTRIPTAAIWNFHRAGYNAASIIEEFPRLKPRDVRAAIAFEKKRATT